MNAVKLSLSVLIWISLASSLLFAFSKLNRDLNLSVKCCLEKFSAKMVSTLVEELPEGGWIKVRGFDRRISLPLKESITLLPGHKYTIIKRGDSLVIKEN